jgi:hypothetical protein
MAASPTYATSVFVNCPFEPPSAPASYNPLFRALIFTVEFCGFSARCALEVDDAGETRAEKIVRLIRECRLGIHDISRTESTVVDGEPLPRFNMPYEFGLFVGFKHAGRPDQRRKVVLVLDREPYRYRKFLSDIAGQDIKSHGGDPERLVAVVRAWLRAQAPWNVPGERLLTAKFRQFRDDLPALSAAADLTEADLETYADFHQLVTDWLRANAPPRAG